jgi:hypothetical protein
MGALAACVFMSVWECSQSRGLFVCVQWWECSHNGKCFCESAAIEWQMLLKSLMKDECIDEGARCFSLMVVWIGSPAAQPCVCSCYHRYSYMLLASTGVLVVLAAGVKRWQPPVFRHCRGVLPPAWHSCRLRSS